jgi:quercetin dioxygenase-like cupin family protein
MAEDVRWFVHLKKVLSIVVLVWAATLCVTLPSFGQASARPCPPVEQRTDEAGPACFTGKQDLGQLPSTPIYWYLVTFPTRAAAEAAKGPTGTVVESLGKIWLFTVADSAWHSTSGDFVAKIGPIPVSPDVHYEAVYMQSIFTPGMTAPLHTHSGPEVFYTLTGETCLEMPDGVQTGRGTGHTNLIPGGPPMLLMAVGTEKRRGVVLILHDSSHPATTMEHSWTPKGLCKVTQGTAQ